MPRRAIRGAGRRASLGRISVYAQGGDYHKTVKKALKALARFIVEAVPKRAQGVRRHRAGDGKAAAQAAGIGWQGKHTNLVCREHGSWLFLGVIFTEPGAGARPARRFQRALRQLHALLDACPTRRVRRPAPDRCAALHLLPDDRAFGPIPLEFREAMGNRIYGCDDCLAACPWNRFAQQAQANRAFLPRAELVAPRWPTCCARRCSFRELFAGSPIKRIGASASSATA
jgi:epoxyqueuosine reductase